MLERMGIELRSKEGRFRIPLEVDGVKIIYDFQKFLAHAKSMLIRDIPPHRPGRIRSSRNRGWLGWTRQSWECDGITGRIGSP